MNIKSEISIRAKRGKEMVGDVQVSDIEAVSFALLDMYYKLGELRTDRPEPNVVYQKKMVDDWNDSDAYWIYQLGLYRHDIEINDGMDIPLDQYQQSWFDYITGKTSVKPEPNMQSDTHIEHYNKKDKDNDLPF